MGISHSRIFLTVMCKKFELTKLSLRYIEAKSQSTEMENTRTSRNSKPFPPCSVRVEAARPLIKNYKRIVESLLNVLEVDSLPKFKPMLSLAQNDSIF